MSMTPSILTLEVNLVSQPILGANNGIVAVSVGRSVIIITLHFVYILNLGLLAWDITVRSFECQMERDQHDEGRV